VIGAKVCVGLIGLGLTLAMVAGTTLGEPTEEASKEGQLDPDYAAGKAAIAAKDWGAAIRLLPSAALRDTRNADIENYLGYATARVAGSSPPSRTISGRCSSIPAIAAPTSTSARRTS
jgi:hypothetical protein